MYPPCLFDRLKCVYVLSFKIAVRKSELVFSLLTARQIFICAGHCRKLLQAFHRYGGSLRRDGIVRPFSLFASHNDFRIAEYFHVVGKGGLGDMQIVQQDTGTFFAALEQLQDFNSVLVAKRLEYPCYLLLFCLQARHLQ